MPSDSICDGFIQIDVNNLDLLLPWQIDLVVWQMIDQPALKNHIERVGIDEAGN